MIPFLGTTPKIQFRFNSNAPKPTKKKLCGTKRERKKTTTTTHIKKEKNQEVYKNLGKKGNETRNRENFTMSSVADLLAKKVQQGSAAAKKHQENAMAEHETTVGVATEEVKEGVTKLIDNNNIVVFSKSYCPYCRQAKMALRSIDNLDFVVVELDDGEHDGWQVYISELAKTRSVPQAATNNTMTVPQIFIGKKYIGGADDLADLYTDGGLATMLGRSSL